MRSEASTPRRRAAFTLVELMVVIALIGILTAVIVPEMRGTFEDARLRSSSRRLVNVCSLAYSRAVSRGRLHRVRLEAASGRFVLEERVRQPGAQSRFAPIRDVPESEGEISSGVEMKVRRRGGGLRDGVENDPASAAASSEAGAPEAFVFYPDGTADGGEILLRSRDGFELDLRLNPTTARVEVVELKRE